MSAELHEVRCPWCTWKLTHRSAAYCGARLVTHANAYHDLWLAPGKAEYFVLGDPKAAEEFGKLQAKQRKPGDDRPWREIRGGVAA